MLVAISLILGSVAAHALEFQTLSCSDAHSTFQLYQSESDIVATYKNEKTGLQRELKCDGSEKYSTYRCSNGELIASVWPHVAARGAGSTVDVVNINGFMGTLTCQATP